MARKPYTDKDNTFRQWRTNHNMVSHAVGDVDNKVYVDTFNQAQIDALTLQKHETTTKTSSSSWSAGTTTISFAAIDVQKLRVGMVATSPRLNVNTTVTAINYTSGVVTISIPALASSSGVETVVFSDSLVSHTNDLELRKVNRSGDTMVNLNITGNLTVDGAAAANQVLAIGSSPTDAKLKTLTSSDNTIAFVHANDTLDVKTTGTFPNLIVIQDELRFGDKSSPSATVGYVSTAGSQGGLPIGSAQAYESLIKVGTFTTPATSGDITTVQFPVATWRSVEYTIQVQSTTTPNRMVTKIMALHDGTDVSVTEYGTLRTQSMTHDFTVDIVSGNLTLQYTGAAIGDVIRIYATALRV